MTAKSKNDPLTSAAIAIGAAMGTFAGKNGMDHPPPAPRRIAGKFVAREKHRLPRKMKKAGLKQPAGQNASADNPNID